VLILAAILFVTFHNVTQNINQFGAFAVREFSIKAVWPKIVKELPLAL
jgi:hypothetical protein